MVRHAAPRFTVWLIFPSHHVAPHVDVDRRSLRRSLGTTWTVQCYTSMICRIRQNVSPSKINKNPLCFLHFCDRAWNSHPRRKLEHICSFHFWACAMHLSPLLWIFYLHFAKVGVLCLQNAHSMLETVKNLILFKHFLTAPKIKNVFFSVFFSGSRGWLLQLAFRSFGIFSISPPHLLPSSRRSRPYFSFPFAPVCLWIAVWPHRC